MNGYTKKLLTALRQTMPIVVQGDNEDPEMMLTSALWHFLAGKIDFRLYPVEEAYEDEPKDSIGYIERAYDRGYDAVIADGKLLGFRNGMPS